MKKSQPELSFFKIAFFMALGLILVLMTVYTIGFLGLLAGIAVNPLEFPLAIIAAFVLFYRCTGSLLSIRLRVKLVGIILGIIVLSGILSGCILDTSWDGQWYHLSAISRIAGGWNPLREPFYPPGKNDIINYIWIWHYPKFSWISAAVIYKCTGWIETGKMINQLIAWATFFNCCYVLRFLVRKDGWCILLSLLLALNPVLFTQLFSNYVDGIMGSFLVMILLQLLAMEIQDMDLRQLEWIILGCSIIMTSNLKFTGLILSGALIFLFSVWWLIRRYPLKVIFRKTALFASFYALAFFLFGFNPYWTNYRLKQSPFYPANDPKVYELVVHSIPPLMKAKTQPLEKMGLSLLSECNNDQQTTVFHGKNPFIVHRSEVLLFATTDVRLAGFGPLFQLVMWLSVLLLAWSLLRFRQQPFFSLIAFTLLTILLLTALFPESWWARYFPLFYLVPFLIILLGTTAPGKSMPLLSMIVLAVLCLNMLLVGGANIAANIIKTRLIREEMASMRQQTTPVKINFRDSYFQATRTRLMEAGVRFVETDTLRGDIRELRTLYKLEGFGPKYSTD